MKKLFFDRIFSIFLLLGWMLMIFTFSAQTGNASGNTSGTIVNIITNLFYKNFDSLPFSEQLEIIEFWQILVRKTAHFSEYAILGILSTNALRTYKFSLKFRWALSSCICVLYAISDEIHQYFVPGRACRFLDVCIDTAGAVSGIAFFLIICHLICKKISIKHKKEF